MNPWCEAPAEFRERVYDFGTEVYFLGRLFECLITENFIKHFKYSELLDKMCHHDPTQRIRGFFDVYKEVQSDRFSEISFSDGEFETYRSFSDELFAYITKIENETRYVGDIDQVCKNMKEVYQRIMLEETAPDFGVIGDCFMNGTYRYNKQEGFSVAVVQDFLRLFTEAPLAKKRIILANLHSRLDAIPHYDEIDKIDYNDIPF